MKIEELYAATHWLVETREDAVRAFDRVVDGFESEAMSKGIVLDWSTLEFAVDRIEHEYDDDEEVPQVYYSRVASATVKGVKVAEGIADEGGEN